MNGTEDLSPDQALAAGLKRLKAESGLSFGRLAARTNYSASSLERYVNGKALPPRGAVGALAAVCGGDARSLLTLLEQAEQGHGQRMAEGKRTVDPGAPSPLQGECERLARAVVARESRVRHRLLRGFPAPLVTFEAAGSWRSGPSQGPGDDAPGGDSSSVGSFFSALSCRRLAIVGEQDSGKTLLGIELVLQLAAPLVDPEQEPPRVPMVALRLPGTDWRPGLGVEEWLVDHLVTELNTEPDTAAELVAARHVLPVVDGLDLLDDAPPAPPRNAAALVAALDRWADVTGRGPGALVVVCSDERTRQLERLGASLDATTKVGVRPLRTTQIHRFLHRKIPAGHPAAALREALLKVFATSKTTGAGAALRRPWRLLLVGASIAARTSPSEAGEPEAAAALPSDRELLRVQIDLATRADAENGRPTYDPDRVYAWLMNIAAQADRDGTATVDPRGLGRIAGLRRFGLTLFVIAFALGAAAGAAVTPAAGPAVGSLAASVVAGAFVLCALCAPPLRCRVGLLAAFWGRLLPLGVNRFLRWCGEAGLLRVTGSMYQLRHHGLNVHDSVRP
ncbi:helix-turn-helix domain-containing protein [Actinomadura sp. NPDC000600]|uniref:helix-turn-helix domain-containing protein n=1 Tax=Actinomadura sp. NPDC000600 TaxID=3154262 RepID=UPI003399B90F